MNENTPEKEQQKKKLQSILIVALVILLAIVFWTTDCSSKVLQHDRYDAYEFALKRVEERLKYPETAEFPSFKECTIENAYVSQFERNGRVILVEKSWEISGMGTVENQLGMTMNFRFSVVVLKDEYGMFECYSCKVE